jgi:hypothetical protein
MAAYVGYPRLNVWQPFNDKGSVSKLTGSDGYLIAWNARQGDVDSLAQVSALPCGLKVSAVEQVYGIEQYRERFGNFEKLAVRVPRRLSYECHCGFRNVAHVSAPIVGGTGSRVA